MQTLHFRDFYIRVVIMLGEKKAQQKSLASPSGLRETCHATREDDHTSYFLLEIEEVKHTIY